MPTQPDEWPVPNELRRWIGHEFEVGSEEVEAGAIRKFADAYMDPNPLWRDNEYARKTPYKGIVAPPTFYHCLQNAGYGRIDPPLPWKVVGRLNGGNEFEFFEPARPGDVVTGQAKVMDVFGRISKRLGPMVLWIIEVAYINQKGRLLAKQRSTWIRYEAKG